MGAVFALASATIDITTSRLEAVATGMRVTFAAAAILIVVALASRLEAVLSRGVPFLQIVNRRMAVALRELGRIERTLFILDWLQSVELRRRVHVGLNKGEARNVLDKSGDTGGA